MLLLASCGDESTSQAAEEEALEPCISELFKQLNRSSRWMAQSAEPLANPQHYIDYQDCQFVGGGKALCSGLANYVGPQGTRYPLGGIHLIELETFRPLWQIPVEQFTEGNPPRVMTQNPFFAEIGEWGLRFHFIPEDDQSFHYIFRISPAL